MIIKFKSKLIIFKCLKSTWMYDIHFFVSDISVHPLMQIYFLFNFFQKRTCAITQIPSRNQNITPLCWIEILCHRQCLGTFRNGTVFQFHLSFPCTPAWDPLRHRRSHLHRRFPPSNRLSVVYSLNSLHSAAEVLRTQVHSIIIEPSRFDISPNSMTLLVSRWILIPLHKSRGFEEENQMLPKLSSVLDSL